MQKRLFNRKLGFEPLENRLALDGNVAAFVWGADLVIIGDNAANEVAVFQLAQSVNGIPAGAYIVAGGAGGMESAASNPTTINGAPYVVIPGPQTAHSDLRIDLRGGDDLLVLGNVDNFAADTNNTFSGVTHLLMRPNMAFASAQTTNLAIRDDVFLRLGQGNDLLGLDGLWVGDDLFIDMGFPSLSPTSYVGYHEAVAIFNSRVNDSAWIATHGGNDNVLIGRALNESESDQSLSNDPLNPGGPVPGLTVGRFLCIYTGAGNDDVWLNGVTARYVGVWLGSGSDSLRMTNTSIWWLKLDGGYNDAAIDTLYGGPSQGVNVVRRQVRNIENTVV